MDNRKKQQMEGHVVGVEEPQPDGENDVFSSRPASTAPDQAASSHKDPRQRRVSGDNFNLRDGSAASIDAVGLLEDLDDILGQSSQSQSRPASQFGIQPASVATSRRVSTAASDNFVLESVPEGQEVKGFDGSFNLAGGSNNKAGRGNTQ